MAVVRDQKYLTEMYHTYMAEYESLLARKEGVKAMISLNQAKNQILPALLLTQKTDAFVLFLNFLCDTLVIYNQIQGKKQADEYEAKAKAKHEEARLRGEAKRAKKEREKEEEKAKAAAKRLADEVCVHLDTLFKETRKYWKAKDTETFKLLTEYANPEQGGQLCKAIQKFIQDEHDRKISCLVWDAVSEGVEEIDGNVVVFENGHILDLKQVCPTYAC